MHFAQQRVPLPDRDLGHHGSKFLSDTGYENAALVPDKWFGGQRTITFN